MHLAQRTYILLVLTAVLAIAGLWSSAPELAGLWRWPLGLLLLGVALESWWMRSMPVRAELSSAPRGFLGRPQPVAFVFHNSAPRPLAIEYVPVMPPGFEGPSGTRQLIAPSHAIASDALVLTPVRLGTHAWPALPARVLGRLGLIWWSHEQALARNIVVAPDVLHTARARARGISSGSRPRRAAGAGSELHQLRGYVPGDPLARIDWKATARLGNLVSREFSEDQHLDILIAIDAGRASRVRAGPLDRLGLYANIAARFAETATPNDDRVGLLVFSDRPLALVPPTRGLEAIVRVRRALEELAPERTESDPLAAAVRIRALLKHRSLVVLLADLADATLAEALARAVRLLSPPHLVVLAGVHSPQIAALAARPARGWRDPWIALAAREHEERAARQRTLLRKLGAPVIAASEELLERAVLEEYELLRRSRRIG